MTILSDLYRNERKPKRKKGRVDQGFSIGEGHSYNPEEVTRRKFAGEGIDLAMQHSAPTRLGYKEKEAPGCLCVPMPAEALANNPGATLAAGSTPLLDHPDSDVARREIEARCFEVPFIADWIDAVFLHYEVDTVTLAEAVPFSLDTYEGKSYVSLVAFTMQGMRPKRGGNATRWITASIATHQFLNLRTYVRHRGRFGIFFIKEWLNHSLAVKLGPRTFGLPYHRAAISYEHSGAETCGTVVGEKGPLQYGAHPDAAAAKPAGPGTLDEFLLERYTAFTNAGRRPKFFRVWHKPWKLKRLSHLQVVNDDLFNNADNPWSATARLIGGHFTEGVEGVWMGRPHPAH